MQSKIHPRLPLLSAPMRMVPCTKLVPPLRVGTAQRVPSIITTDNKNTGPAFITQEEEEMDTDPPPRQYPTRNRTSLKNYKALVVNALLNSEFNLSNHIA